MCTSFSIIGLKLSGMAMIWERLKRFMPEKEPRALVGTSDQCLNEKCGECKGYFLLAKYPAQAIWCLCKCHQKLT
jgi:hypothetical protein